MSGNNRYLLDTNAVIALLAGDSALATLWSKGKWAGVSVVSVLEFLSWPGLESGQESIFRRFLERVSIVNLDWSDKHLMAQTISLRKGRGLKLPDAIILASALANGAVLVTRDEKLLAAADAALPGSGLRY
jgi:predicted nucleic acid-binding protein